VPFTNACDMTIDHNRQPSAAKTMPNSVQKTVPLIDQSHTPSSSACPLPNGLRTANPRAPSPQLMALNDPKETFQSKRAANQRPAFADIPRLAHAIEDGWPRDSPINVAVKVASKPLRRRQAAHCANVTELGRGAAPPRTHADAILTSC
jgi:hypothetical protein